MTNVEYLSRRVDVQDHSLHGSRIVVLYIKSVVNVIKRCVHLRNTFYALLRDYQSNF